MRKVAALTLTIAGLASASAAHALTLTSPDIKQGGKFADEQVANLFGCKSPNVSPALAWSGAPKGTKSFAISMYDPDAPTGSGFWHWWVVNIPADVAALPKGAGGGTGLPASAMQGRNDYSTTSYGGPCPPPGKPHRYEITVFALDVDKLDVDQSVSPAVIGFNAHAHALAKATLTGLYGR
jgi:Raf kinase inhibitor-like YbhB/YbcL family protein